MTKTYQSLVTMLGKPNLMYDAAAVTVVLDVMDAALCINLGVSRHLHSVVKVALPWLIQFSSCVMRSGLYCIASCFFFEKCS